LAPHFSNATMHIGAALATRGRQAATKPRPRAPSAAFSHARKREPPGRWLYRWNERPIHGRRTGSRSPILHVKQDQNKCPIGLNCVAHRHLAIIACSSLEAATARLQPRSAARVSPWRRCSASCASTARLPRRRSTHNRQAESAARPAAAARVRAMRDAATACLRRRAVRAAQNAKAERILRQILTSMK
jgi:hypothetical protein